MPEEEKTLLEYVSDITEINDISEYMQDEKLDEALGLIVKMTVKPDIPPALVARTILLARALAAEMHLKGKNYMLLEKDTTRKNMYLSVAEQLIGLCDAMKYLVRNQ
jgi:hypothetical protein